MKGVLKIYHPEETLKYHIKNSYSKAVYLNNEHFLEVEIITDENQDHVEDDSLQYPFPQIALRIFDYPLEQNELSGQTFEIEENEELVYSEVDLYTDQDAFLYKNRLEFTSDPAERMELIWSGEIDDFYTDSGEPIPFKLKCHFEELEPEFIEEP